jgi:glycosyltransferase involved in cell wall biosynthesis
MIKIKIKFGQMNKKLAIITTHPVQYYAPLFKEMAKTIKLKVFYTWGETITKFDPGFGKNIKWDIPLLEGYDYSWVRNTSKSPGSDHFKGIINPDLNSEIEQWGAEAILVFGWSYHSHLKAMRYFKGKIPVYFRGDSTLLDEKPGIKTLMRRVFLRWVYHYVDKTFYVGKANRKYFIKHGLDQKCLVYAPHAIDNDRFKSNEDDNSTKAMKIRTDLNIMPEDVVVLFSGKFESKKNPLLLLNAFIELGLKNMHLVFVGNGKLENELKEKALGIGNIQLEMYIASHQKAQVKLGGLL